MEKYGLGRHEFLPVRSKGEAVAKYLGYYLNETLAVRQDSWQGVRRVEWARGKGIVRLQVNKHVVIDYRKFDKVAKRDVWRPNVYGALRIERV